MGNHLGLWSEPTPEERVIQNNHSDLREVIIYPLAVASKLLQEGVVSKTLVSEVSTTGRSQLQNSTAVITAVTASIHSEPNQFQVFMSVLEDSPESANLARRLRNELSESCNARAEIDVELMLYFAGTLKPLSGRLMERKGQRHNSYFSSLVPMQSLIKEGLVYTDCTSTKNAWALRKKMRGHDKVLITGVASEYS